MSGAEAEASLRGKRAVVTGSSQGIGREVARALAAAGAAVVVNGTPDRDGRSPAAEAVAREIAERGGTAVACAANVADADAAGSLIERCVAEFGAIDALVNCAGVPEPDDASILDLSERDFRAVIDVHLVGTFHCCRHAARRMVAQRSGAIVNTSSHAFLGTYAAWPIPPRRAP
jgi:NAD(P)-dependent dehydrogenase (short-subunit alcohol dehydrogenase family)